MVNYVDHFDRFKSSAEENRLFIESANYDSCRHLIMNDKALNSTKIFIQHLQNIQILHEATLKQDLVFVKALINFGVDPNSVDSNGQTIIDILYYKMLLNDSDHFLWLAQNGARGHHPLLGIVCDRLERSLIDWRHTLVDIFEMSSDKEIGDHESTLSKCAESSQFFREILEKRVFKIIENEPDDVLFFFQNPIFSRKLISCIQEGILKEASIKKVLIRLESVSFFLKNHPSFWIDLEKFYNPKWAKSGDLKSSLAFERLLQSETCYNAINAFLRLIDYETKGYKISPSIKQQSIQHIQKLEQQRGYPLWYDFTGTYNQYQILKQYGLLEQIDAHGNSILFSKYFYNLSKDQITLLGFDPFHLNKRGENALESHLRDPFFEYHVLKKMTELGMRVSDRCQVFKDCQFRSQDPYIEALLVLFLIQGRKKMIEKLPASDCIELRREVLANPELEKRLGKYFLAPLALPTLSAAHFLSSQALRTLMDVKPLQPDVECYLEDLCSFWKGTIPDQVLDLVPDFPWVSLLITTLKEQKRQFKPGDKLFSIEQLFPEHVLTKEEMLAFNHYMFEHPEDFSHLVINYMKLKRIHIFPDGDSKSKYAKITAQLMRCTRELTHVTHDKEQLPPWQKNIVESFNRPVIPTLLETFELPQGSDSMVGRTVVFEEGGSSVALKFLKAQERFSAFKEKNVTEVFQAAKDHFASRFHHPIGVYCVKHLPKEIVQKLEGKKIAEPATIYVYQADPDIFKYLQDLNHPDYLIGRSASLEDATKMILMGIYPDFAPLFHNQEDQRRYVFLVDLVNELSGLEKRGSGRIDQAFFKSLFPNARYTGLTDLADATGIYDNFGGGKPDLDGNKKMSLPLYTHQMHALSSILLADMLILVQRFQKADRLNWQDQSQMEQFGQLLAEGFAKIGSVYSGKSYESCLNFAIHCGINWSQAAAQTAYWSDITPSGYPQNLNKGIVPSSLYEKEARIIVREERLFKNFHKEKGCSTDGHQDIGIYNGPSCLEEYNKALHLLYIFISLRE